MNTDELVNRFKYHPPKTDDVVAAHTAVRTQCMELALYLNGLLPEGREKALAMTHLEEVMMCANAAIARNQSA